MATGASSRLQRHLSEPDVPGRVEGVELDDALVGERGTRQVVRLGAEIGQPPRRLDRRVVVREQFAVLLDRALGVAQLLREPAHHRVRAVRSNRQRDERRRLLERLERGLVALLGERRAERELRAIAARAVRGGRLQRGDVAAALLSSPGFAVSRSAARTAPKRWSSILSNVTWS